MNFLFLLNGAPYISEYLGFLSKELELLGHNIIIYINSEFAKKKYLRYYSSSAKVYERNKIRCDSYNNNNLLHGLTWKILYESWDRKKDLGIFNDLNYSFETIKKTFTDLFYIIQNEAPDVIINEMPANLLTEIAYYLANTNNIKYFGLIQSRIPNRIDIMDKKYKNSKLSSYNLKNLMLTDQEKEYYLKINDKFINHEFKPGYLKAPINNIHNTNLLFYYLPKLKKTRDYLFLGRIISKNKYVLDYETRFNINFVHSVKKNTVRKLKKNNYKKYLDSPSVLKDKKYFLFPLHLQPEASTSGQAMFFSDLISTIKYIAFSLPFPYILAVKEHPSAVGTRDSYFYKEIKKIPNVIFLDPFLNNKELIGNSDGIITLTSTLGLEAALIGKPVIVMGEVFYDFHPNCYKVSSYDEIAYLIKSGLSTLKEEELKTINAKFWKMYDSITIKGDLIEGFFERNEVYKFLNFVERGF